MKKNTSHGRIVVPAIALLFLGAIMVAPLAAAAAPSGPQYYAVIAACSQYENPKYNLPKHPFPSFSDRQLLVLYEALLQGKNWDPGNIIVLLNDNATKENIVAALQHMAAVVGPDDYFLFSWSGHGTQVIDADIDEGLLDPDDIFDEAICPHDTAKDTYGLINVLTDDELNGYFSAITCRAMTLIFDCCLSGGMVAQSAAQSGAADQMRTAAFAERLTRKLRGPQASDAGGAGRVVLMSTQADYVERGIFLTGFPLITGLAMACRVPGLADKNRDGVVSSEEAFRIAKPLARLQACFLWAGVWLYSYASYAGSGESGALVSSCIDSFLAWLILEIESKLITHHYMANLPLINDGYSGEVPLFER